MAFLYVSVIIETDAICGWCDFNHSMLNGNYFKKTKTQSQNVQVAIILALCSLLDFFKKILYKICGEWNSVKYFHISFEWIWHWISSVLMLLLCTIFAKMKDLVCCNTQLNILRFRPELENQKKFIKPYWFIDIISICFFGKLLQCYRSID